MIRYLWCSDCYRDLLEKRGLKSLRLNGLVVVNHGRVLSGCLCDHCNVALFAGDTCYAISLLERPGTYKEWESEYMKVIERIEYPEENGTQQGNRVSK